MEEKKIVPITIMGHRAKITSIAYELITDPPAWRKEEFVVWINFEEPINGLLGFGVTLPVENYSEREFLAVVEHYSEERVKGHLEKAAVEKVKQEHRENREITLQAKVDRIKLLLGM